MTSRINNILKPKSKDDLIRDIKSMSKYEFLYRFKDVSIKGFDIGFMKKWVHFFGSSKNTIKKLNNYYWYVWGLFVILQIYQTWIFPSSELFPAGLLEYFSFILSIIITVFLVLFITALVVYIRYVWWQQKNDRYSIDFNIIELNVRMNEFNILNAGENLQRLIDTMGHPSTRGAFLHYDETGDETSNE